MKPESRLKVGELAARADMGVQTLHYYERLGLLPKPDRSATNHRLYPADSLRRVQFIKKARALGFTLEEIKEVLGLRGQGRAPCRCVADVGKKTLAGIGRAHRGIAGVSAGVGSGCAPMGKGNQRSTPVRGRVLRFDRTFVPSAIVHKGPVGELGVAVEQRSVSCGESLFADFSRAGRRE
jgi:DNA-binding transcriptional MerR regulator